MKYTSAIRAALLCSALSLVPVVGYATQGGEGNNTNCNGVGNPNSPCVPGGTTTPGVVNNGGAGGAGGQGGTGGQGGRGGNAAAIAAQAQLQAQRQRQTQAQRQIARGGDAQANVRVRGGDQNVTVQQQGGNGGYDDRRAPAYGAAAAIPPQCGAGFSAGGNTYQGTGALGFSWETESCRKDRLANRMAALGRAEAGIALLCTMDEVRESMAAAGTPCPSAQPATVAEAPVAQAQMTSVRATQLQPQVVQATGCPTGQYPLPAPYQNICR